MMARLHLRRKEARDRGLLRHHRVDREKAMNGDEAPMIFCSFFTDRNAPERRKNPILENVTTDDDERQKSSKSRLSETTSSTEIDARGSRELSMR